MSHNVMDISYIDCSWKKCKNLQIFETIEIFFYITTDNEFAIDYNLHKINLDEWKEIVEIHQEDCKSELYDENWYKIDINEIKNKDYYNFKLKSKDFNLYRNINLIFYRGGVKEMEKALEQNTWN